MPALSKTAEGLAKVNIYEKQKDGSCEVEVCFSPVPEVILAAAGVDSGGKSKAFLALDASFSIAEMYGKGGTVFMPKPNHVQAVGRKLGAILCDATTSGKVAAAYWAVNFPGDRTEWIGEYDEGGWTSADLSGPKKEKWGRGTKLLPALKLAAEQIHKDSDWTMAVFITDGIIEDEQDCMDYCRQIGKNLVSGKMKAIKMILFGVGTEVDEGQLERFDDMFEGTDLEGKVDLWSTSLISSIQDESDLIDALYGELMTDETIVAPSGRVESGSGQELKTYDCSGQPISFSDGVVGKFRFFLPKGETVFHIRVAGHDIEQDCSEVISRL